MSKIIGESFDPYVKEQIKIRQTKLGLNQNNDSVNRYLTGRQSWIRLTSGIDVDEQKCLEIGIPTKYQGNQLASNYILFNGVNSRENISVPKGGIIDAWGSDPLLTSNQYGFNSSQEQGLVPMPFIESIKVPYNGKVLSTPSPKDIFLTVNDEFKSLLFLAIQTPSKY